MSGVVRRVAQVSSDNADNLEDIEKQFAVKVVKHMTTYWSILQHVRGSEIRLTRMDDEILEHFRRDFPDFDPAATIDEDAMKSESGKARWRSFATAYEKLINEYNFGTIVRASPSKEYDKDDTILVLRIQFYAIEISRNRAGLNDWIYEKASQEV